MKIYSIDHTNITEAVDCLNSADHLMSNNCMEAAQERIAEALKALKKFIENDGLVEDSVLVDGLVRQMDAETAIKEAVKESEDVQKKAIEMMVQSCKESNAAKITMSGKRPDGYIFETIVRKDGAVAYDEFSDEQMKEIEFTYTQQLVSMKDVATLTTEGSQKGQVILDIINVCRARLDRQEYSSMEDFFERHSS